jgi:hypothetical protein
MVQILPLWCVVSYLMTKDSVYVFIFINKVNLVLERLPL